MDEFNEARNHINEIDKKMIELFEERMQNAAIIAQYKKDNNLPILDKKREEELIKSNCALLKNNELISYYNKFLKNILDISKSYQNDLINENKSNIITVKLHESYDCIIDDNILNKVSAHLNLKRKVLILTDDLVPSTYSQVVCDQCENGYIFTMKHGESNKTLITYQNILNFLAQNHFTRTDAIVAVGGGLVGDVAGFVASTYMRGIDFYNIPTTLLSQVDSSIGGKTAVNLNNVKNIVGSFYQPKKVLIDRTLLKTLSERLLHEGLVEAFKMGMTHDSSLVDLILNSNDIYHDLNEIITKSLMIKKNIVEEDEKESSSRRLLNFGHTFGHAIEALSNGELYHGECVGIGMLYVTKGEAKEKVLQFLNKYNLPKETSFSIDELINLIKIDKKANGDYISIVCMKEITKPQIIKAKISDLKELVLGGNL